MVYGVWCMVYAELMGRVCLSINLPGRVALSAVTGYHPNSPTQPYTAQATPKAVYSTIALVLW